METPHYVVVDYLKIELATKRAVCSWFVAVAVRCDLLPLLPVLRTYVPMEQLAHLSASLGRKHLGM